MSRSRYRIFEKKYPYFLTSTVVAWLPNYAGMGGLIEVATDRH